MTVDALGVIYAGLVTAGGIAGYVKAGSIASLAAGVVSGCIAAFAAFTSNFYVLLGVAMVLGGVMGVRFANSRKLMPAGIITILSILIIVRCIVYFVKKI